MEKVITLSKKLLSEGNLVVIPRKDYEEYLELKKIVPMVTATAAEKRSIREGRKQIKNGKYLSLIKLRHALER